MKSKRKLSCFAVVIAAIVFCFSACGGGSGDGGGSGKGSDYTVTIDTLTNGTIKANPSKGPAGTSVQLLVQPKSGYKYTTGSLREKGGDTIGDSAYPSAIPYTIYKNVTLTATFEKLPENTYSVTIANTITNGTVTADPPDGLTGTLITLTVTPNSGYVLKSLTYTPEGGSSTPIDITGSSYTFTISDKNVTVNAEFEQGDLDKFIAAGIAALEARNINAAITAFEDAWKINKTDKRVIVYSSLARLASIAVDPEVKKLMKDRLGLTNYPGTVGSLVDNDWMTQYTNEELVWSYYDGTDILNWFDKDDDFSFIFYGITPIKEGYYKWRSLRPIPMTLGETTKRQGTLERYYDSDLDTTVYWYDFNPNTWSTGTAGYYYWVYDDDTETSSYIFVTSTPKIGDLEDYMDSYYRSYLWYDEDPTSSLIPYTGFTVPGYYWAQTVTYDFVTATPRYTSSTSWLPGLETPLWLSDSSSYQNSLTHTGLQNSNTYPLLLFANLVDKNTNGLNTLLDGLLSNVFGDAFEEAESRFSNLTGTVELTQKTLEAFGLSEIFEGEKVEIGKVELTLVFSAVRIARASLEWICAYDWNTDVNFLKNKQWLDAVAQAGGNKPANLPFRNNFLKDRNNGMMAKAKADYIKAIDGTIAAYDYLIGDSSYLPSGYKDTLKDYQWAKDGFTQFKTAISQGQKFYVKIEGSGTTYSNTAADALFGIDLGKFFTPGQLSLDKLIETETITGKGLAPKFYGYKNNSWEPITQKSDITNKTYALIGFKLKTASASAFGETFLNINVSGLEIPDYAYTGRLPIDVAGFVWDWYHN